MIRFYDDYIEKIFKWGLVISLAVMATLNFSNVISRYVIHASISFTEELTTNLFVYNTFFGAALGARRGAHLGLTILSELVPPKFSKWIIVLSSYASAVLFFVLVYFGYGMTKSQFDFGQTTAALGLPEWWFGLAIPVGAFVIGISFLIAGTEYMIKEGK